MSDGEGPAVRQRTFWWHYEGGRYEVMLLARLESTGEEQVVYRSMKSGRVWVRPLAEFLEKFREAR
jgi:hypothetical protein